MIAFTLAQIAEAVSGTLLLASTTQTADTVISGDAQTDSRELQPGQVFFARVGEETDGHLFIDQAIERGAALVVCEHEVESSVAQIVVADATEALGDLARAVIHRARAIQPLTVVGITGSNGKTTTKNLVAAMAERLGPTVASMKSFNNEVGGPLTMLRVTSDTRVLVAEMGASHEGEIARLTNMAPPHIGVVLSVGMAHAGEFGGIQSTYRAKSEMVRALSAESVAVLNRDDSRVTEMATLTEARVRWFGHHPQADVRASDVEVSASGTTFTIHFPSESHDVKFPVLGEHHVTNALAAATVALELGLSPTLIVETLEQTVVAAPGRMQRLGGRDGVTIINDAYNASPDSMNAALKTLAQIRKPEGRTIAVLGEMSELGEFTGAEHDRIGLQAVRLRLSQLVVVGTGARRIHITAINEGAWSDGESLYFENQDTAYEYLVEHLQPNDTVLVKSSNAAGLLSLGDRLGEAYA